MIVAENSFLNRFTFWSIVVHLLLAIIALGLKYLPTWNSSSSQVEVIANAIRVDVVAMPKFTIAELKQMQQGGEEESVEEDAPAADDDLLVEKKKKSFMELMKKLSKKRVDTKIEQVKIKRKRGNRIGKLSGDLHKLVLSGNKLQKGNSLTASSGSIADGEFANYLQQLPDWIRGQWRLPTYLLGKNLKCRIQVYINAQGKLLRSKIIESSGDSEYDRRALRAVEDSTPFPPVPESIRSRALRGDIVLGFPL